MAESIVQFGIIGCAEIARKVSRAIQLAPNATIVAVGSRSLEKAQRFKADNALPDSVVVHGSYDAVLEDPSVHAVYMPLPTSLHIQWAVAAAEKKKHILLEKPVALSTAEFDRILDSCEANGVQFMDGTMWVHHPRTAKMKEVLSDQERFGRLKMAHSTCSFRGCDVFIKNDIRVKPDLDALGALGDLGWYCTRSILWAADYELPKTVVAHRNPTINQAGVILECGGSLYWDDGKMATFNCSFLANTAMELCVTGTRGTLHLNDFIIPFEENSASYDFDTDLQFNDQATGWETSPCKHIVNSDLSQETLMVREFSRLVSEIRDSAAKPDSKWPTISRKTMLVIESVKASIEKGFEPVEIVEAIRSS